jgi:hypothetical protein
MINYDRKSVGQIGGGHMSPLASYSKSAKSFLVMDVAKYKYPPVWIPAEQLVMSMGTTDKCGLWDSPEVQDKLPAAGGDIIRNSDEFLASLQALGCQTVHRGYIIVSQRPLDDSE